MSIYREKLDNAFFKKIDGKIIKLIKLENNLEFENVRLAVSDEDEGAFDIAVLPGDQKIPGLRKVVKPSDVKKIEFFDNKRDMLDFLSTFKLRSPSDLLEHVINDLATIAKRKQFDKKLLEYLGEEILNKISACFWLIDDPRIEERFALQKDIEQSEHVHSSNLCV